MSRGNRSQHQPPQNSFLKFCLKLFACYLFIWVSSIAVHELVHIVQFTLDPRLEFAGFDIFPNCSDAVGHSGSVCIRSSLVGNRSFTEEETREYERNMEIQAYSVQLVYIVISALLLWRKIQRDLSP
jgi:hypothetical protein